jgi:hypothetical protein
VARWTGTGSTDEAANFVCAGNRHDHGHHHGQDNDDD